jgi:hypothetical protein
VVDANPANIGALRELRITLDGFRKDAVRHDPREDLEFAQLVATLSGPPPGTWDAVYNAVITAGGSDDAAFAAASAACPAGRTSPPAWPAALQASDALWRRKPPSASGSSRVDLPSRCCSLYDRHRDDARSKATRRL